jgi:hypothetical protein
MTQYEMGSRGVICDVRPGAVSWQISFAEVRGAKWLILQEVSAFRARRLLAGANE